MNLNAVEGAFKPIKKEKRDITPSETMKRIQTGLNEVRKEVDSLPDSSVKVSLEINLNHLDKKVGYRAFMKERRDIAHRILTGAIPLENVTIPEKKEENQE